MKPLVKPKKKVEVFDNLNVRAFYEDRGRYDREGTHVDTGFYDLYSETNGLQQETDVLF